MLLIKDFVQAEMLHCCDKREWFEHANKFIDMCKRGTKSWENYFEKTWKYEIIILEKRVLGDLF